jgi:hypothetical protein
VRPGSSRNLFVRCIGPLQRYACERGSGTAPRTAGGTHGRSRRHAGAPVGESGVGGFAEELHGTGTEPPQGFKRNCTECLSRAVLVGKVVPVLVGIPKSSGVARGAGG